MNIFRLLKVITQYSTIMRSMEQRLKHAENQLLHYKEKCETLENIMASSDSVWIKYNRFVREPKHN